MCVSLAQRNSPTCFLELEKRGSTHALGEVKLGQEAKERHRGGEGLEPNMAVAGDM